ncbi:MAG: hypothetical protein AAGB26_07605 [Planctomycetota bacterium]
MDTARLGIFYLLGYLFSGVYVIVVFLLPWHLAYSDAPFTLSDKTDPALGSLLIAGLLVPVGFGIGVASSLSSLFCYRMAEKRYHAKDQGGAGQQEDTKLHGKTAPWVFRFFHVDHKYSQSGGHAKWAEQKAEHILARNEDRHDDFHRNAIEYLAFSSNAGTFLYGIVAMVRFASSVVVGSLLCFVSCVCLIICNSFASDHTEMLGQWFAWSKGYDSRFLTIWLMCIVSATVSLLAMKTAQSYANFYAISRLFIVIHHYEDDGRPRTNNPC